MTSTISKLSPEEKTELAEEAYIFAYPILENYRTMDRLTGINTPENQRRRFNTLRNTSHLLGPEFKNIVAPNNDTLYSSTWLDLKNEPLVLSVPEIPDQRYYVFQLVSMYNHNFGYVGARTTGYSPGDYLITGPDWNGVAPNRIQQVFPCETRFAFLLGRTLINGPEDLEQVKAIQAGYRLQPLSQYLEHPAPVTAGDNHIMPYNKEKAQTTEFISYLNTILDNAIIHPDEADMIQRFSAIGIGQGSDFNPGLLDEGTAAAIELGIKQALETISQKVKAIGRLTNGWRSMIGTHGPREVMAGRYLINAAGAMVGLYGNDEEEASNFMVLVDAEGDELDASKYNYTLRFDKGNLPPVKAFWSITMYKPPEILLVENPIQRYAVGDRTRGLRYGDDGSLEFYLQHQSPGADQESNWLPTPPGAFMMALRCYLPDMERFPSYEPPGIRKVKR